MNAPRNPVEDADVHSASDEYRTRFAGQAGAWLLKRQTEIALDLLSDRIGESVLDVGGGHGQIALPLAEAQFRVTVLGSCDGALSQVLPLKMDGRCTVTTGDLLALPFPDRSFTVVTCFRILPHAYDVTRLVSELCRVSADLVLVDYPTDQSINALTPLLFSTKKRIEGNTRPYTLFKHAEIDQLFSESNFKLAARVPQFFLPMVIHRLLQSPLISEALEAPFRWLGITAKFGSPVIALYQRQE